MAPRKRIAVVGSGLAGMSCAYELAVNDDVTVVHDQDLLASTSAVATAICHLDLVIPDDEQNLRWFQSTLEKLMALSEEAPEAGIELVNGIEVYRTSATCGATVGPHRDRFRDAVASRDRVRLSGRPLGLPDRGAGREHGPLPPLASERVRAPRGRLRTPATSKRWPSSTTTTGS